ncbi:hypothetical protein DV451_002758 [Geotrichum candidum]|uniref:Prokaryotic-type class I peptide chain release factors domain-containing protein n=1 Tax=Geotrichum candidum TaxID=1173061 RepID=A0A9P5G687_GEOCN|nr:hypothetical protein DV451_002758 [Geotrichum candidum]KAF5106318.1 hypothetical protein DV453_004039 [Geotrichum candidum]KAF5114512.1 hypothetical protein DV454_002909 [Geotrichum candidum]KAF7501158.1 hypothetical protein DV113_000730 [Geotrichum candidum]
MLFSFTTRICRAGVATGVREFTSVLPSWALKKTQFPPRPKIREEDIEEVFIKGGSQFSRSREQNRKKARELLALKIEELEAPEGQSRNAIIAEHKKQKARKKKAKSKKKYREREEAERMALLGENGEVDSEAAGETVSDQTVIEESAHTVSADQDKSEDVKQAEPTNCSETPSDKAPGARPTQDQH